MLGEGTMVDSMEMDSLALTIAVRQFANCTAVALDCARI